MKPNVKVATELIVKESMQVKLTGTHIFQT